MFAFLAPILGAFAWVQRLGAFVLTSLGLTQIFSWFDRFTSPEDQKAAEGLTGAVGALLIIIGVLLYMLKRKKNNGSSQYSW